MQEPSEFSPRLGDFIKEANFQCISLSYLSCKRDYLIDPDLVQIPERWTCFSNVYLVSLLTRYHNAKYGNNFTFFRVLSPTSIFGEFAHDPKHVIFILSSLMFRLVLRANKFRSSISVCVLLKINGAVCQMILSERDQEWECEICLHWKTYSKCLYCIKVATCPR